VLDLGWVGGWEPVKAFDCFHEAVKEGRGAGLCIEIVSCGVIRVGG
jgi:hypothetical protein